MSQTELFAKSEDVVTIAKLRKNLVIILQNVGRMDFCRTRYVDGAPVGPGCGREIFFVDFRGGRPKCLDDDGSAHRCPEVKP